MKLKINFVILVILYGIIIFIIYLSLINNSKGYECDASNIASWANRGRYVIPNQQNHLLQSILNMIWCKIWIFFGYNKDCLRPLRVLSCIFGAIGVAGFFALLHKIFEKYEIALFGSLGLAFSISYWTFSTDLETHLLPTSTFIYVLFFLFSPGKFDYKKVILIGFIHSLCIYLSGIYIFFTPAIITGIMTIKDTSQNRYKALIWYLFSLMLFWAIPFFVIGIYFYKVDFGLRYADNIIRHLFIWFRSFEKLTPFFGADLFILGPRYLRTIHYITTRNNLTIIFGIIVLIFYAMFFSIFINNSKYVINRFSRIILLAFSIIIPYQLILLIYEPWNIQRYTHFSSAFWLLLSCAIYPFFISKKKLLVIIPFIFIVFIFCINLIFYIYPRHKLF